MNSSSLWNVFQIVRLIFTWICPSHDWKTKQTSSNTAGVHVLSVLYIDHHQRQPYVRPVGLSVGSSCLLQGFSESLWDARAGCTSRALEMLNTPAWRIQKPLMWICTVICPHINVNVLPPLYLCCVIIGLIVLRGGGQRSKGEECVSRHVLSGVLTGVGGCSQNVIWTCTVRLYSSSSEGFSTTRRSEEVSGALRCHRRGQLVPGQLHGCGVAGKGSVLSKPRRGFCICSAVDPPAPPAPPRSRRSPSAETRRRDSWPVLPQEEEGECVFTRVGWGGCTSDDITAPMMHLNTCCHWQAPSTWHPRHNIYNLLML